MDTERMRSALFRLGEMRGEDECWPWHGAKMNSGYGQFGNTDEKESAHRASWQVFRGPIPDGLHVCHKCDNRTCWNPNHLFLGTAQDNIDDCIAKGRFWNQRPDADVLRMKRSQPGERHGMARLTWEIIDVIRNSPENGRTMARRFGISEGHVSQIRHLKTWLPETRPRP